MTTLTADRLSPVSIGGRPADFSQQLMHDFRTYGFGVVTDHGIPAGAVREAEAAARRLFALPDAAKRQWHIKGTGGARGYTPFGVEAAKDAAEVDQKEFWHVGRELPAGHRYAADMPPNIWPDVPGFREAALGIFAAFEAAGARLLEAIAIGLDLPAGFFAGPTRDGNSVLRFLHYPPQPAAPNGIRAAAHEDINVITLLLGAEEAGLELLTREGAWLPVKPPEGALVVNIGDMLQRLTNHVLPSTTHRVANPVGEAARRARYSMPFFLHFAPDYLIETLPGCITPENPDRYPEGLTANAYLLQRLREIRLL
ncbi:isopenicillin N synthase family dioxygenase [Sphingosinicella microcystinivorans]|uniref:isopenicillin N synthase family dioxygenase n=1 Tax=Sphingosinicella microcystinivorans TaxID=335406 RepID=UPI0022F3B63D|nr:2-oxoglutarate and iron-dependent oxygenase domain-containing protein [Sphingosinicella microcystinivorans]WBX85285.1 2-oxoglutarate and iron-dependent oxygenase domain-containing protein [Sphingosinicella microcystinivorans]